MGVRRRRSASGRRLTIVLVALAVGLAAASVLCLVGHNVQAAQAQRYHSAPLCDEPTMTSCRRDVAVTIVEHYTRTECTGSKRNHCSSSTYIAVQPETGARQDIEMATNQVPVPEFADAAAATVEYFEGNPMLVIGRNGTRLQTSLNPDAGTVVLLILTGVFGFVALVFGGAAGRRIVRQRR